MPERNLTRREVFTAVAAAGVVSAWLTRAAVAQGSLANLAPEEPVDKTVQRLFGARPIRDGASIMNLDLPLIAEDGGNVAMSVEVKSPMTPQSYVKARSMPSSFSPRARARPMSPPASAWPTPATCARWPRCRTARCSW